MNLDLKKMWSAAVVSIVAFNTLLHAADKRDKNKMQCPPKALPDQEAMNPSARPFTLDPCCCEEGEFFITVAGFYWKPTQDGMEYAVDNAVNNTSVQTTLIDAEYKNPDFKWNLGFKVGIGYNTTHDGWDIGFLWTHFHGRASSHDEAETDDNHTLLPLWSAFAPLQDPGSSAVVFATDIETDWKLQLDMLDVELGRQLWTGKYLSLRPHLGVRAAWIRQDYDIENKGGSFSVPNIVSNSVDKVDIENNFRGVGVRAGLDATWNFTKEWGLISSAAISLLYGRFTVNHNESLIQAVAPFAKTRLLDTEEHFNASRAITDLLLGIQYCTLFNDEQYKFMISLAWEYHAFLHQNQMWKIMRLIDNNDVPGENLFDQRRGTLVTQGWTLTAQLNF